MMTFCICCLLGILFFLMIFFLSDIKGTTYTAYMTTTRNVGTTTLYSGDGASAINGSVLLTVTSIFFFIFMIVK